MIKQQLGRLGKAGLIYGLGGALSSFISFLLLPLFTAYLTPADYGISAMLGVVSLLATSLFSLGSGTAMGLCYFERNDREWRDRTVWNTLVMLGGSASVLVVLAFLCASPISILALQTPRHSYLVTLTLITAGLTMLRAPLNQRLQFEEKAKLAVALNIASSLVSIAASVVMVVGLHRGVRGLIEAHLIAQAIVLLVFLGAAAPRSRAAVDVHLLRDLLRFGLPMVPSFAFLFILQQGSKYGLQWFHGDTELGLYSIGSNFGMIMALLVSGFSAAWTPYFLSFVDKQQEAAILFGRIFTYHVFGFGGISLLFYILARLAVMTMTSPAFHPAYVSVGLGASAQWLMGVFGLLLPGTYFAKEVRYTTLVQGVAAALAIGANWVLIPWLGVLGAALANMLGVLAMCVVQQIWNHIRRRDYLPVVYEWGRIGRFSVLYIVVAGATLYPRDFSRAIEMGYVAALLAGLVVALYALTNDTERQVLSAMWYRVWMRIRRSDGLPS